MVRVGRVISVLLMVGTLGAALGAQAAGATGELVVKIDVAAAVPSGPTTCTGPFGSCTVPYAGLGVSVGGTRIWQLTFSVTYGQHCGEFTPNPWILTATDGSGDGLRGTFLVEQWEVTAGSGAYAGYVSAVPGGEAQNFRRTPISPGIGVPGTGNDCRGNLAPVPIDGIYSGTLEFHIEPAGV